MLNLGQSNKDTLAKLMATENITVIHKKVPTAYFDVKSRTLCIPMLKENMSQSLNDLFVGHEVGHALYTPVDGWHDSICEKGGLFKGYLNVVEDCRIEEKVKNKYPGLRRSFYKGYEELATDDFFGIKGKDLSKLNLIDKINIHFKIGAQARIQFSNEEQPYIERCKNLKSFEEVMELASELFDHQKKKTDEQMESMTQEQLEALIEEYGLDPSEDGEDSGETIVVDGQSNDEAGEEAGEESGEESETSTSKTGGKSVGEQIKEELNKSETDEEFRKNERRVFEDDDTRPNKYYEITSKIKYENFIVSWKDIDTIINSDTVQYGSQPLNRAPVEKTVKTFIDNNKKIVAYMVKQFEMKKAAADYKRSKSAKTGDLNMSRLHLYQLKDDIFNRVQITPDGKNHGLVMIIDWSGSMHGSVKSTVEQASLLSMFCRRLQIPFRLFAFSDGYYGEKYNNESPVKYRHYGKLPTYNEGMEPWDLGNLSLLEIFNEKMSNTEFTRSMENWFQLAYTCDGGLFHRSSLYREDDKFDKTWYTPSCLHLSGTPLDASLLLIRDYLIDFKKDYGLDICSFITLTDGDSHRILDGPNVHLVDRKLNKVFKLGHNNRWNNTGGLLQWIKETAYVKTIGFYLTKGSGQQFFYNVQSFCNASLNGFDDYSLNKRKEFNNLATSFTDGNYDLSIIINQKKIEIDYNKDELNVEVGASKGKLKSALVKAGTNKMKQRIILNKFVDQMAV